eukprot:TRINITY_DN44535_c0_g1_i1.p1 TRINITY_DN44535_c0_g1~~TRINITY_DN44535_c0_g1_i1.p1  ORF type:complete len:347 (+),score=42.15 TRINITY_DN44535_c0_g1_i1:15-1055(+)
MQKFQGEYCKLEVLVYFLFLFQLFIVVGLIWLWKSYRFKIIQLQDLRKSERKGRITAEKKLAKLNNFNSSKNFNTQKEQNQPTFQIIGEIQTCYGGRNGTPRQPSLVPLAFGTLKLHKKIPSCTLDGLSQFSHCWLIYLFHKNTNLHKNLNDVGYTFKSKIKVPRLQGEKLGVFSTRSPHRPNPIGLSLVKILKIDVENGILVLSGLDLVNQTPIIDIKPYVPFADGDINAFVPKWVVREMDEGGEPLAVKCVNFDDNFYEQLKQCWLSRELCLKDCDGVIQSQIYDSKDDFVELVSQVLSRDIRSVNQREKGGVETTYHVVLDGLDVTYRFDNSNVTVIGVDISK